MYKTKSASCSKNNSKDPPHPTHPTQKKRRKEKKKEEEQEEEQKPYVYVCVHAKWSKLNEH